MQWNEFRSHIRHLSAKDQKRVEQAFALGELMHKGQLRKSGEPYFTHPISVADMLADLKADADTIIAALLHDTVEDTPLTLSQIDIEFDGTVASLIDGVTKLGARDLESPDMNEQLESLRKIFTLMQEDVRIMVIKLYDRLHNMQTAEFLRAEKRAILAKETYDVYVKIADRLCMQDLRDDLEALCLGVLEPEVFGMLTTQRIEGEQRALEILQSMRKTLNTEQPRLSSDVSSLVEPKSWEQLKMQQSMGGAVATGLTEVTVVFTCRDVDTCYRALGALHQVWQREVLSFQDFINAPSVNGYRGIHTTIILNDGTRVRCKIRTQEMHDYARKGVTTLCFTGKQTSILDVLPWAHRLTEVTGDTAGKSEEFWQSLQSDILGESITIYGPGEGSVQLPKGSTALDGVFALFPDNALSIISVRINGIDEQLHAPLNNAVALSATFDERPTVRVDWIGRVKTRRATAAIRVGLAAKPDGEKVIVGKMLVNKVLAERKRGFVDEFDEQQLVERLAILNLHSLNEAYIAVAEGKTSEETICDTILGLTGKKHSDKPVPTTVRYDIDIQSPQGIAHTQFLQNKFSEWVDSVHYKRHYFGGGSIALKLRLPPSMTPLIRRELEQAGAEHVMILSQSVRDIAVIALTVILWGLDPVIAHMILHSTDITPNGLTAVRFLTFFLAALFTYSGYMFAAGTRLKPISPLRFSLAISGAALFATAILSYIALKFIPATQYIVCIIGGLAVMQWIREEEGKRYTQRFLVGLGSVVLAIIVLSAVQGFSLFGILTGIGSSAGFAMYSSFSKRYQKEEGHVYARYPAFVFWLSIICVILAVAILHRSLFELWLLPNQSIMAAIGFSFVFCFLPYSLYFDCMRRMDPGVLDRLLPLVCVVATVGEAVATMSFKPLIVLPLFALFLLQHFIRRRG